MARGPQYPNVHLELTEPNKIGEGWLLTAVATVARGKHPESDINVQFYLNGTETDRPVPTLSDGRAKKDFYLAQGVYTVEACIVGTTSKDRQIKAVGIVTPKPPVTLLVTAIGPKGKQTLLISVADEDGKPIKAFRGTVLNGDKLDSFETREDGTAVYDVDFADESRRFEIRAGNTPNLIKRFLLLGPEPNNTTGATTP